MLKALSFLGLLCAALLWSPQASAAPPDPLCPHLRAFVKSVKARETRKLEFHTSWGGAFKGMAANTLSAKYCEHGGYAPAKAACDDLMTGGSVEFAGNNAMQAMTCLSPGTRFSSGADLSRIDMTFAYEATRRDRDVTIRFDEDPLVGGKVLTVAVSAY